MPQLHARVTTPEALRRCSLIMCVWDWDHFTADDTMGQVALGLDKVVDAAGPYKFSLPISHHGKGRGTISGTIEVFWPHDSRHNSKTVRQVADHPGCCSGCSVQ